MKRIYFLAIAAALVPAIAAQAQSPQPEVQQTGSIREHVQQKRDAVADAYAARHVQMNSYAGHTYTGMGYGHYSPQVYHGHAYCQECGDLSIRPRHHYTYGYQRPRHLVYPQPQATGGVVVYPYYTHKGPSDFFRK